MAPLQIGDQLVCSALVSRYVLANSLSKVASGGSFACPADRYTLALLEQHVMDNAVLMERPQ